MEIKDGRIQQIYEKDVPYKQTLASSAGNVNIFFNSLFLVDEPQIEDTEELHFIKVHHVDRSSSQLFGFPFHMALPPNMPLGELKKN